MTATPGKADPCANPEGVETQAYPMLLGLVLSRLLVNHYGRRYRYEPVEVAFPAAPPEVDP